MQPPFQLALVTGSTGWLGKRLVHLLGSPDADHGISLELPATRRLRCLVLPGEDCSELRAIGPNVSVMAGDLRNPVDCARFVEGAQGSYLFHTAGVIHPRRVRDFYRTNVDGVRN